MKSQILSTIPHLTEGDTVITNSQDKCNIFNDFFLSKATVPGANDPVPELPVNDSVGLPLNTINTSHWLRKYQLNTQVACLNIVQITTQ